MAGWKAALEEYEQIKETLETYEGILKGFAPVVQAAQELINDAISQVKSMYENPVVDTEGNVSFNSDFNLDLSPYSDYLDTAKDYKQILNDFNLVINKGEIHAIMGPNGTGKSTLSKVILGNDHYVIDKTIVIC